MKLLRVMGNNTLSSLLLSIAVTLQIGQQMTVMSIISRSSKNVAYSAHISRNLRNIRWHAADRGQLSGITPSTITLNCRADDLIGSSTDKINAGIRVLQEDSNLMLLWKTSNVALFSGEKLIRPASIPVADWVYNHLSGSKSTLMFQHLLSTDSSGIVVVAKSEAGYNRLSERLESRRVAFMYEAVIHEEQQIVNSGTAIKTHLTASGTVASISDRLAKLTASMAQAVNSGNRAGDAASELKFTLTQSANSGTYGTLHSVTVDFSGSYFPPFLSPTLIEGCLASGGLVCLKEGKRPYLALVSILVQQTGGKEVNVKEKTPSKFMKIMRREEILYHRINENRLATSGRGSTIDGGVNDQNSVDVENTKNENTESQILETVLFQGLQIQVSNSALRPRNSSAVLVRHAISSIRERQKEMQNSPTIIDLKKLLGTGSGSNAKIKNENEKKEFRVLDLGCGTGALLLATLTGLNPKHPTQTDTQDMAGGRVLGVGVDLDQKALRTAQINAECNGQLNCEWIAADFGQLHTPDVHARLVEAVLKCESKSTHVGGQNGDGDEEGLFDVILCNPPFLSSRAAAGRVTPEDRGVLVGGLTGLEPYIAICLSVTACRGDSSNYPRVLTPSAIETMPGESSVTAPKRSLLRRVRAGSIEQATPHSASPTPGAAKGASAVAVEPDRRTFLSALPLLSEKGCLLFQVPGGERGYQDVYRAVTQKGMGFTVSVVADERGVKRCLILSKSSTAV